jgi:drug/metabolite transporter (DMT)-like permease
MHWFWFALAAPALFALSNQIDKFLLHRHESGNAQRNIASLTMYSSLIGLLLLPVLLLFGIRPLQDISVFIVIILTLNGVIGMGSLWLYFFALQKDHASVVAPLFQMIPVIQLIGGYVFLNETLTSLQIFGFFVIFAGALLIVLDTDALLKKQLVLKRDVLLLMTISSFGFALNAIIYKWLVIDTAFSTAMFWDYAGAIIFGFLCAAFSRVYREEAQQIIISRKISGITVNIFNELLYTIGIFSVRYAMLGAPVAIVSIIGATQPLFVICIGYIATIFFPHFISEDIRRGHIIQKIIACCIIIFGVVSITIS